MTLGSPELDVQQVRASAQRNLEVVRYEFSCDDIADRYEVGRFDAVEELNRPYRVTARLEALEDGTDMADLLGRSARLVVDRCGHSRPFCGIVDRVTLLDEATSRQVGIVEILPALAALRLTHTSRIFQGLSALSIVERVLNERLKPYERTPFVRTALARSPSPPSLDPCDRLQRPHGGSAATAGGTTVRPGGLGEVLSTAPENARWSAATMCARAAATALVLATMAAAASVRADIVPPAPDRCPPGLRPDYDHGGGGCVPAPCDRGEPCGEGAECRELALCHEIVADDPPRERWTGPCEPDGRCPNGARCERTRQCEPVAAHPEWDRSSRSWVRPPPPPPSTQAPARARAEPSAGCTVARAHGDERVPVVALVVLALASLRRVNPLTRGRATIEARRASKTLGVIET